MELITVHEDHFVSVPPPQKKQCEDIQSIATADELVQRYPEVFSEDLWTVPGTVHLRVEENAGPSLTPPPQFPTALRGKFKAKLGLLESLGVLTKCRWARSMGEQCCYWNEEVRYPQNMRRSTSI